MKKQVAVLLGAVILANSAVFQVEVAPFVSGRVFVQR